MLDVNCVAPTGCLLGQEPVWSASEGFLWWVDRERAKLHRFNPKTGNTRRYDLPVHASAIVLQKGRLVMIGDLEIGYFDPETEAYDRFLLLPEEPVGNRTQYAGVAPDGSLWFGTMDKAETRPQGSYYRLVQGDRPDRLAIPFMVAAGPVVFAPDRKTFYTCDPAEQEILAFDYNAETGALTNRRLFASTFEGGSYPAGLATDREGHVWNAEWAGSRLVRYSPEGAITATVDLPISRPTGLAFGGADLKTLFVTSARLGLTDQNLDRQPMAGCLFALEVQTPGLPLNDWGETG
jgi:sugar lactone lactonase YvrE